MTDNQKVILLDLLQTYADDLDVEMADADEAAYQELADVRMAASTIIIALHNEGFMRVI